MTALTLILGVGLVHVKVSPEKREETVTKVSQKTTLSTAVFLIQLLQLSHVARISLKLLKTSVIAFLEKLQKIVLPSSRGIHLLNALELLPQSTGHL